MPYGSLYYKILSEKYSNERLKLKRYRELLNIKECDNNNLEENYKEYEGKNLIIMVCSSCNADCSHCYISYEGDRDPDELVEMVTVLKQKYNIELNGAEVLTNLDYLKAYKIIGQKHLISNGKAIIDNPNTIKKLKENDIKTVALSYHFGIQDKISIVSEAELLKIIKVLKENDIEVRLMTTINSANYNMINKMCENAISLGARAIKFTNYIAQGNALNMDINNILNEDQKKYFFEQLLRARQKHDINELLVERCGTFGKNLYTEKDNFKCTCAKDSVVLTPDNNIYSCVFLAKPGYEIGRFSNNKIYIKNELITDEKTCLSDEVCNKTLVYRKREMVK